MEKAVAPMSNMAPMMVLALTLLFVVRALDSARFGL
jgi:hypothetical protein